jgi:hypothetical protein
MLFTSQAHFSLPCVKVSFYGNNSNGKGSDGLDQNRKKELELYITQGKAFEALYRKVNQKGKYNDKIKHIRQQIQQAQQDLQALRQNFCG